LETQALANKYANGGMMNSYPPVNVLLDIARNTYYDMPLANTWTGVTTKAKGTAFQANANTLTPGPVVCWNCSGAHTLRDCKQKQDNKKIEENKKKQAAANKDNGQGGHGGGQQGRGCGGGRGG
jgi:hypothetical protein